MKLTAYTPALALTVATSAAAATLLLLSSPEANISRAFDRAAAAHPTSKGIAVANAEPQPDPQLLHLSSAEPALPPGLDRPLRTGDHVAISGPGGAPRDLEVKSVQPLSAVTPAAAGQPLMQLVTCVGHGPEGEITVRFVIETAAPPAPAGNLHHSL